MDASSWAGLSGGGLAGGGQGTEATCICRGLVCRAPRVGLSAGRLVLRPLGTPVTGFPVHSCTCHPVEVVFLCLLDGGCRDMCLCATCPSAMGFSSRAAA